MNSNEIILYAALGHDGFMQYRQYKEMLLAEREARLERERQERRKLWRCFGSVLLRSVEPTAEYYQKWHDVDDSRHPNIKRCFSTVEYVANMDEIAYDEYAKMNGQY